jgi:hypothetical protein
MRGFFKAILLFICLGVSTLAHADINSPPKGDVIVTIKGDITAKNSPDGLLLDLDHLKALPQHSFTTSTTWTDGRSTYQGVLLKDLIAAVGAYGTTITITALDDYANSMPMTDAKDDGPILAYLVNGKTMSIRDKGPLWLMYPFDDNPDYRNEEVYAHSIWQIAKIEFGK